MIQEIDLANTAQAQELLTLQRASYQVEAELIGSFAIPGLTETLEELQNCGEKFYGYFIEENLAGAISFKLVDEILDIYRLVVAPAYFRRGIARALLDFLLEHEAGYTKVIVQTGSLNIPAKTLYEQAGFNQIGDKEVIPGLFVTLFEKHQSYNATENS